MTERHYTCHTCNTQFTSKNPKKANKFCSVECYREHQRSGNYKIEKARRPQPPRPCSNCGKDVRRHLSVRRNGKKADNIYCDRDCYNQHRARIKNRIVGNCKNCDKPIRFADAGKETAKFCSMQCRDDFNRVGSSNCIVCGVEFCGIAIHKTDGKLRVSGKGGAKTCSHECWYEFYRIDEARKEKISKAFTGSKHPNWQGGSSHRRMDFRGSNWQSIRQRAMKRDGYKCKHCGIDHDEQMRRHGRSFSINHIVPFHQLSGDTVKANRLSNLETLCDSCHTRADWKYRKENSLQLVLDLT